MVQAIITSMKEAMDTLKQVLTDKTIVVGGGSIGMSFIEAASYGLPTIGSNVGGVPEAVSHKETGLIIDSEGSPSKIADEIVVLWNDKSMYEEMSIQARKRYSEQMNWKNWAKRVKEVLSKEVI